MLSVAVVKRNVPSLLHSSSDEEVFRHVPRREHNVAWPSDEREQLSSSSQENLEQSSSRSSSQSDDEQEYYNELPRPEGDHHEYQASSSQSGEPEQENGDRFQSRSFDDSDSPHESHGSESFERHEEPELQPLFDQSNHQMSPSVVDGEVETIDGQGGASEELPAFAEQEQQEDGQELMPLSGQSQEMMSARDIENVEDRSMVPMMSDSHPDHFSSPSENDNFAPQFYDVPSPDMYNDDHAHPMSASSEEGQHDQPIDNQDQMSGQEYGYDELTAPGEISAEHGDLSQAALPDDEFVGDEAEGVPMSAASDQEYQYPSDEGVQYEQPNASRDQAFRQVFGDDALARGDDNFDDHRRLDAASRSFEE